MSSPMLAKGRCSLLGHWYVITTITHARRPRFLEHGAATAVIHNLQLADLEGDVESHAWVLMPDHLHWLFTLRRGNLATCMRRFKSRSARAVHLACGSGGVVWQAGYYDHALRCDEDATRQARYIIENPVRSGLTGRLNEYPYWWCRWIERAR